eukprot:COSAG01_NODE_4827_length_4711_cov_3.478534_1_plen_1101_part_00
MLGSSLLDASNPVSQMSSPMRDIDGAGSRGNFVPQVGNRYCRANEPASGVELRCAILTLDGGNNATVQFYDKEKDSPKGDPVTIPTYQIKPIMYPDAGERLDGGAPLPKYQLLNTNPEEGLTAAEVQERTAKFGPNALEETQVNKLLELAKKFWGPMPIMIWIAALVEVLQQSWTDFAVLITLQIVNGVLGWHEDMKAGDAVAALRASLKPEATCKRNGQWQNINAGTLVPGDIVLLGAGASVPADCELLPGAGPLKVDQAALTGESLPVTMNAGSVAKMGSTITAGECEGVVFDHGPYTFFGKTASMIANVEEKGHFQIILLKITGFLMGVSFVLVAIACALLLERGEKPLEAVAFGVVLLVASIPIAMPVVSTTTMALGSRELSKKGAIVTRLAAIEEVAGMTMLCSDKTGTLTKNIMELQDDTPIFTPGVTRDDVLMNAALAAKWKEPPKDALDTLVLKSFNLSKLSPYTMIDHIPFNPVDKRTESTIQGPDGFFKVSKGAPHVILHMAHNSAAIHDQVEGVVNDFARRGIRCLSVARTQPRAKPFMPKDVPTTPTPQGNGVPHPGDDEVWEYLGVITFLDPPRADTAETIRRAKEFGVGVKMITGDQTLIAQEMARMIGLGDNILLSDVVPDLPPDKKAPPDTGEKYGKLMEDTDGFAQVFPEHKFMIVEALKQRGWVCGMTGDGVNDAPALKVANIGIAVEGATDAAQAASDIVLTDPGLSTIVDAIILSRIIFQRLRNYVIYRIACTIQLLLFFFIGVVAIGVADPSYKGLSPSCTMEGDLPADLTPGPHEPSALYDTTQGHAKIDDMCHKQFELPVTAIVLIAILNDGCIISIAYDTVVASPRPEAWRLPEVFVVSTVLGVVAVFSSIFLLWCGLTANAPGSHFESWGLVSLPGADTYSVTRMDWQKAGDGKPLACPTTGCSWDMCSPGYFESTYDSSIGNITTYHPQSWNRLNSTQQLDWQQPEYCFSYAELQTTLYMKISLSDFLTVAAARTRAPFFSRAPGKELLVAAAGSMLTSTFISHFWNDLDLPDQSPLPWGSLAIIWVYCLAWFVLQDIAKLFTYSVVEKFYPHEGAEEGKPKLSKLEKFVLDNL